MKMVVTDLDGTLLRSDKTISDRSLNIIKELQSAGVIFAIATGRPPRSVFHLLPFDFSQIYTICYNGAEIFRGDDLIYKQHIEAGITSDIVSALLAKYPKICISVEISNQLYTNFDIKLMKGWIPPYSQVDFSTFEYKPAAKILIDLNGINDYEEISALFHDACSMIVTDGGILGQIAHKDVSKLNAVKNLTNILNLEMKDVMAFGDDFNDLEMLIHCGTGVAMDNSPEEVKNAADIITLSNDDDGVANELEKILKQLKQHR